MESIQTIVDVISSVGFPIVVCGVLFWGIWQFSNKVVDKIVPVFEKQTKTNEELCTAVRDLCDTVREHMAGERKEGNGDA